ncbi:uncharacterized protein LOC128059217 [Budorcas taxicolor]|uniref:uncharacterized protein LOC128059217 n=1 Tax=Budorcas taxicolor TaxID=37181 RepID=UPI0022846DDD|nr:uncharacterized protein LOC128059217 [Budorcas taxicolor]
MPARLLQKSADSRVPASFAEPREAAAFRRCHCARIRGQRSSSAGWRLLSGTVSFIVTSMETERPKAATAHLPWSWEDTLRKLRSQQYRPNVVREEGEEWEELEKLEWEEGSKNRRRKERREKRKKYLSIAVQAVLLAGFCPGPDLVYCKKGAWGSPRASGWGCVTLNALHELGRLPEVSLPGENWLHAPYLFLRSSALPGS